MRLIEDWQNRNLRCFFCGNDRSVKYSIEYMESGMSKQETVFVCNMCALRFKMNEAQMIKCAKEVNE